MSKENEGVKVHFYCPNCQSLIMTVLNPVKGSSLITEVKCKHCKHVVQIPLYFRLRKEPLYGTYR